MEPLAVYPLAVDGMLTHVTCACDLIAAFVLLVRFVSAFVSSDVPSNPLATTDASTGDVTLGCACSAAVDGVDGAAVAKAVDVRFRLCEIGELASLAWFRLFFKLDDAGLLSFAGDL